MKLRINDKTTLVALALIILVGLAPLTWYRSSYTIISGDNSPIWFGAPTTLSGDMNIWYDTGGLGHLSAYPTLAALLLPIFTLQTIGFSNGMIQIILLSTMLICSGVTMFFFLSVLIGKKPGALLVGSLFYMFCMLFIITAFSLVMMWIHAFLPLLLALFIRIIRQRLKGEHSNKSLLTFLASFSFFMSFLTNNASVLIIALSSFVIVFLYLGLVENLSKVTLETLKIIGPLILVCLWWIIPFALVSIQTITAPGQSLTRTITYNFTDSRSSILNILWFNPLWGWQPMYYQYTGYYSNPIVIITTFVPIILSVMGLLFRRKERSMQYLFLTAVLVTILLEKGTHGPLQNVNLFLDNNLPFFGTLFREPQSKFAIVMAIFVAPLLACSVDSLIDTLSKVSYIKRAVIKKIIPVVIVLILCLTTIISAGPMFLGIVAESKSDTIPFSSYVQVPSYWEETNQFFNNDTTDFKVLVTPDDTSVYNGYTWGYWGSDAVPYRLIQKPVLFNTYGYQLSAGGEALNMTYQALENENSTILSNLLTTLNVKYILLRHDLEWNFCTPAAVDPTIIQNHLGNCSNLQFVKSMGQLDVYEYKEWTPHKFFGSTTAYDTNVSSLAINPPSNNAAQLSYTQVSPSEYKIHITTDQPLYLFLSESYDAGWKLVDDNSEWYTIPFSGDLSQNHTSAYGFGNMWYITKTGKYDIIVFYEPQSYLYYSAAISLMALCLFVAYEVICQFRAKRRIP